MVYVMSDLHGCYDLYIKMLDEIKFSDEDTMYILGDFLDRGKDGIKILQDIKTRKNIVPLVGNHDCMAYTVLKQLCFPTYENEAANKNTSNVVTILHQWEYNGGRVTYDAFQKLSKQEQASLLDFIISMDIYKKISVGKNDFVLTHAGLGHFDKDKPLSKYSLNDFIWTRMDYSKTYFDNKFLVSGHTPTDLIDKEYSKRIYQKNNHIAVDCGAIFLGTLGCVRLDDFKEFYVTEDEIE